MTRFDRRKLLTSGAAAAVLMGSGMTASAQPKRGGLLRAALSGGTSGDHWLNPGSLSPFMMNAAQGAVFETLTEIAPDGSLRGELLADWRGSDAGRIWELRLRADTVFHDGAPIRPEDVIASLAHHRATASGTAAEMIDTIAPMPDGLRVTLIRSNRRFPYLLSDPRLIIFRQGDDGVAIGSGLYRPVRFEAGKVFEGRRVKDHHRDGQAGWFDEVSMLSVPDARQQAHLLRARRVDVADLARFEGDGFTHHRVDGGEWDRGFEGLAPMQGYGLTSHVRVAVPRVLGAMWPVDDARIAERWWMA